MKSHLVRLKGDAVNVAGNNSATGFHLTGQNSGASTRGSPSVYGVSVKPWFDPGAAWNSDDPGGPYTPFHLLAADADASRVICLPGQYPVLVQRFDQDDNALEPLILWNDAYIDFEQPCQRVELQSALPRDFYSRAAAGTTQTQTSSWMVTLGERKHDKMFPGTAAGHRRLTSLILCAANAGQAGAYPIAIKDSDFFGLNAGGSAPGGLRVFEQYEYIQLSWGSGGFAAADLTIWQTAGHPDLTGSRGGNLQSEIITVAQWTANPIQVRQSLIPGQWLTFGTAAGTQKLVVDIGVRL